tara:strand:+ start:78163 stop:78684 length:522 start_codon:yes stop_codon:yes gene_type:complete
MTEVKEPEVKSEVKPEVKEPEVKSEAETQAIINEVVKEVLENKKESNSDIFVTEDDTFSVKVEFYKDGPECVVKGIHEKYDPTDKDVDVRSIDIDLKYPSQGDVSLIMDSSSYRSLENMEISDVMKLESIRLSLLLRTWSLDQDTSRLGELAPEIVQGILNEVRNEIGMKGII